MPRRSKRPMLADAFAKVSEAYDGMGIQMAEQAHGRIPEDAQRQRWERIAAEPARIIPFVKNIGKQTGKTTPDQLESIKNRYIADMRKRYPDVKEKKP